MKMRFQSFPLVILAIATLLGDKCHAFQQPRLASKLASVQQCDSSISGTTSKATVTTRRTSNASLSRLNVVAPAAPAAVDAMAATTTSTITTASSVGTILPSIVTTLASPVGAVGVLAFIVLIHELGHYLAARYFGITVEEFSIGFGPKLFGFNKFGNEFNLRALPLGGYVRFPENYNIEKAQELEELANKAAEKRRIEEGRDTVQDYLIDALTFGILDERRRKASKQKRIQEANNEQAKAPFWKRLFNRNGSTNPRLNSNDPEDYEIEYYDDPNLLQNRPWQQRFVVLSGGVFMNIVLAFSIYFGAIGFGSGIPQPIFEPGVVVTQTPRSTAPSSGLLYKNDLIVGVNGNQFDPPSSSSDTSLSPLAAQKEVNNLISAIRKTPAGEPVKLTVFRGSDNNNKEATRVDVFIQPTRTTPDASPTIGVLLSPNMLKTRILKSENAIQASKLAAQQTYDVTSQTLAGFGEIVKMMLQGGASGSGGGGGGVSGPIGLIKSGSDVVSTRDLTTVLMFASAISINLGVVNALPFPALDGGQIAFVLAEAVTGKKIDQRLQEGITSIFILFLLLVTVRTAFGDVTNILAR